MDDKQEPSEASRSRRLRSLRTVAALATATLLAACAALQDATEPSAEPTRVSTEGAEEAFPSLAEVPSEPRPSTAPEVRAEIMEELAEDRAAAEFVEIDPLETAAPRNPFASSLIISGDSVTTRERVAGTTREQVAGLPAQAPAQTQAGQLAAIVFFSHGSSALDPRDRGVLRDLVTLREQRGGSLRVVGHASSRTRNSTPEAHRLANFEMSMDRANVVLEELLRLGVPPEAARAEAVGDAEPVYHEFMPSGEAGNRRVEIFLEN